MDESLWIDELHSVWSASGSFGEIAERAQLGNQLSPYFYLLWSFGKTFGTSEVIWRGPSLIAWLLAIVVTGSSLGRQPGRLLLPILASVVFDRSQLFYATEARPYAIVGLVVTCSWLAMANWSDNWIPVEKRPIRLSMTVWIAWCLLNCLAFWLQPISLIAILPQFVFLGFLEVRGRYAIAGERAPVHAWPALLGGTLLVCSILPAVGTLAPVWDNRFQWAAFASGCSLSDLMRLLPMTAYVLPVCVAYVLARAFRSSDYFHASHAKQLASESFQVLQRRWWMWFLAWSLPCLLVALSTAWGMAPLMHRRYVYAAAFPLVFWYATCHVRWFGPALQKWILAATLIILTWEQGSWQQWQAGRWHSARRGENWREAIQWIELQRASGQPIDIFCACNLIEGARPINPSNWSAQPARAMDQYLTLPCRSIYSVSAPCRFIPLANDPRSWLPIVQTTLQPTPEPFQRWLLVRTSKDGLERRLAASQLAGELRGDFGGVQAIQLVQDVGFKKSP